LNKLGAIVSTPHLAMRFPSGFGDIIMVHADQRITGECCTYIVNVTTQSSNCETPYPKTHNMVVMVDHDLSINDAFE